MGEVAQDTVGMAQLLCVAGHTDYHSSSGFKVTLRLTFPSGISKWSEEPTLSAEGQR